MFTIPSGYTASLRIFATLKLAPRRYSLVYDVTTSLKSFFIALFPQHRFYKRIAECIWNIAVHFNRSRKRIVIVTGKYIVRSLRHSLYVYNGNV